MSLAEYATNLLREPDGSAKPYVTIGDGPNPVVIIPGVGDGMRTCVDVAIYLAWFYRVRRECRLLVLSRRDPYPAGFGIERHTDDMIRTIEELQWGPCVVECLSAGGPIGQRIAATRPDLVRGLILSSSLHHVTGRTRLMLKNWSAMARAMPAGGGFFSMIEHKYRPPGEVLTADQLDQLKRFDNRQYPNRLVNLIDDSLKVDHRDLLAQITCPTLVVAGQKDRLVPVRLQTDMADRIPNSQLIVSQGYGHFHDLENPEYHDLVTRFVSSLAEQPVT